MICSREIKTERDQRNKEVSGGIYCMSSPRLHRFIMQVATFTGATQEQLHGCNCCWESRVTTLSVLSWEEQMVLSDPLANYTD